jgi:hypothetical protein
MVKERSRDHHVEPINQTAGPHHRRPVRSFALATLASGVIAWRFIFPVPALSRPYWW